MTERFVVIPVGQGDSESREQEVDDDHVTLPDDGEGAGGDFGDNQGVIPILEYSREPNKYGKTNFFSTKVCQLQRRFLQTYFLSSFGLRRRNFSRERLAWIKLRW